MVRWVCVSLEVRRHLLVRLHVQYTLYNNVLNAKYNIVRVGLCTK